MIDRKVTNSKDREPKRKGNSCVNIIIPSTVWPIAKLRKKSNHEKLKLIGMGKASINQFKEEIKEENLEDQSE